MGMEQEQQMVTPASICQARERIGALVHRTALQGCRTLSERCGAEVFLKLENLQKTGSFKIRGAANAIYRLEPQEALRGIVCASAGNHAQGVAWAATARGLAATVVMPLGAPAAKVEATRAYGAQVVLHGHSYDEACAYALELQRERGARFVHAFDDAEVIAGQGTIALEMLEAMYDVQTVVAPIGGGGLLAGLAVALKEHNPRIRVIGVQAAGAPSMSRALAAGRPETLGAVATIADGIAVKRSGDLTFRCIQRYVDEVVLVTEAEIAQAMLFLLERCKLAAEGAGVVGVAALLAGKLGGRLGKVATVVSGGNLDPLLLARLIAAREERSA